MMLSCHQILLTNFRVMIRIGKNLEALEHQSIRDEWRSELGNTNGHLYHSDKCLIIMI